MLRRVGSILIALFALLPTVQLSGQSTYTLRNLVSTGNRAPVPPRLSGILEYSFNDKGQVAYVGDGGLLFRSAGRIRVVAAFGAPAPGGGKFIFADTVSLNSAGQIVFRGYTSSKSGLFLYNTGILSKLITDGTAATNGVLVTPLSPVMCAAGDVAFLDADTTGLYLFSRGVISPVVVPGDPAPGGGTFQFVSQQSINQSDQVVFVGYLSTGGSGVYLASGGTITKIIAMGDMFPDGGTFDSPIGPSINDAGQVAFGGFVNNSAKDGGVLLFSGGHVSVVVPASTALPNGSYLSFASSLSLNNAGQIAFIGFSASPVAIGVFLYANGPVTQVIANGEASPDGDTFGFNVGSAQISNAGQILLVSSTTHHNNTLYLYSSGQLTRVAGQGDTVNHIPRFVFPFAFGISAGETVLVSDITFPGGNGYYLASPGVAGQNTSLLANVGASLGDGVINYVAAAGMNHSGQVALAVTTSDVFSEILLKSGNNLTVIAGGPGGSITPAISLGQLAINDLGQVAFLGDEVGERGLFLNSNGQTKLLLSATATAPGGGTLGNNISSISLNNQGQIAFFAQPSAPSQNGMFTFSNGTLSALALNGATAPGGGNFLLPSWDYRFGPVMNDNGNVAFATYLDASNARGVFLFANNTLTRIAGPGDSAPGGGSFVSADFPSINASGQVAFKGQTAAGTGVFLYNNGKITKVAGSGDIAGTQILGSLDEPLLNEKGDVAFSSVLTNGTSGVFIATPRKTSGLATSQIREVSGQVSGPSSSTLQQIEAWYRQILRLRRKWAHHRTANETVPKSTAAQRFETDPKKRWPTRSGRSRLRR